MEFFKYIFSRGLPKTGQVTSYAAGDDAEYQAGWWQKRFVANNRPRLIYEMIAGDAVVHDRATGLMWAADADQAGCNFLAEMTWVDAIAYANVLSFAGFTDWRLPNIQELLSLVEYNLTSPCIAEPPFLNTASVSYWTSSSYQLDSDKAWRVIFIEGKTDLYIKTDLGRLRCVCKGI